MNKRDRHISEGQREGDQSNEERTRTTLGKGSANPEKEGGKEDKDKRTCTEDGKGRGKEFIGTWKDIYVHNQLTNINKWTIRTIPYQQICT